MNQEKQFIFTSDFSAYVGDKRSNTYVILKLNGAKIKLNHDNWWHLKTAMNELNAEVDRRYDPQWIM